jgi:DMSO/TMAO reductase YedYZ molybdopterin-dependent catalytic subunit
MWFSPTHALDPKAYRLSVSGLVEKPLALTLDDLRSLPNETQSSRLKCVLCWSSRTAWGGFRFGHLMELVKPVKGSTAIRIDCADKWYVHMSIKDMLSPRVLLALDMAGKPLSDQHGAPLRLIDPGRYGYKSAKLITSITFVELNKGSMACDVGPYYTPDGEIQEGYDRPLDLGEKLRRKIPGGEITAY